MSNPLIGLSGFIHGLGMTLFFYSEKHNSVHFLYLNQRPIKTEGKLELSQEKLCLNMY